MPLLRRMESDRPSHNSLIYLTKLQGHAIEKEDTSIDTFALQMVEELYGVDLTKEFVGVTRSYYTLEGHYLNLWNYDRIIYPEPTDPLYFEAIEIARKAFRLPNKVKPISWNNLAEVPFVTSTGAGYGYIGKKGDPGNHDIAIGKAVGSLMHFKETNEGTASVPFRYTPDLAWTRTQLGTFDKPKMRNVWGKAFHNIILEGITAAPLLKAYMGFESPMVIGKSLYKRLPELIHHVLGTTDDQRVGVGIDYSKFDSSLQPWLHHAAFDVLGSNIDFEEDEQRLSYEYTIKYFDETPILMPDGRLWLTKMGLPSGSYYTQMIGSVCNYIIMMYVQLKTYGTTFETFVLGDDSLFGLPERYGYPDLTTIAAHARDLYVDMHTTKSIVSMRPNELQFLGHTTYGYKIHREQEELLKLLIFTEYPVTGPPESLTRMKGLLLDSALTTKAMIEIYEYSLIRAKELGFREADQFSKEDRGWLTAIVGSYTEPKELDLDKIYFIT